MTLLIACLFAALVSSFSANGQGFGKRSALNNSSKNLWTSLEFGPDGRLYATTQYGKIYAFTIKRNSGTNYSVTKTEVINLVEKIKQRRDTDGGIRSESSRKSVPNEKGREVTGILLAGTANKPVMYVSSSDVREGGGGDGDVGVDNNSGVISRLTWKHNQSPANTNFNNFSSSQLWDKVDLVRGLPRSEENHATNGMQIATINGVKYLFVCSGGHTNGGAPSEDFARLTEFALSGAILSVNLNKIEKMEQDLKNTGGLLQRDGDKFVYDIPTTDDPTRNNIQNPDWNRVKNITPGGATQFVDPNDPWGSNDGLNQAKIVPNGPVEIWSPGYRNAYDLVVTQDRRMYVTDNGANQDWGGFPDNEGGGSVTNKYVFNSSKNCQPGESRDCLTGNGEKVKNQDHLEYIGNTKIDNYNKGSYYGGHPCPIRANPNGAGLYTDINGAKQFRTQKFSSQTTNKNIALPKDWPPVPNSERNTVEGDHRPPGKGSGEDKSMTLLDNNSNGICEYTSSSNGGNYKGDLFIANNQKKLIRIQRNSNGTLKSKGDLVTGLQNVSSTGYPLDVTAQGDNDIFPGTVWIAMYNGKIVVLEPDNTSGGGSGGGNTCKQPGQSGYSGSADSDNDGYTNADEVENGTDHCNGGDQPDDFDGDKVSNINDSDDDEDGIPDVNDPFQIGFGLSNDEVQDIPLELNLFSSTGYGFYSVGFTGLMTNKKSNDDYTRWVDVPGDSPDNDIVGGAPGLAKLYVTPGRARNTNNNQEKGFQFGVKVGKSTGKYYVNAKLVAPFHNPTTTSQHYGPYIGNGDQSNYLQIAVVTGGLEFIEEYNDVVTKSGVLPLPALFNATSMDFYFLIDPNNGDVTPAYSIDEGPIVQLTQFKVKAKGKVLEHIQTGSKALAVGVIGTQGTANRDYSMTIDYFEVKKGTPTSSGGGGNPNPDPTPTPTCDNPVPSPWSSADVGNTGATSEACFDNGTYSIEVAGDEIGGDDDDFHFVYQDFNCSGEIIAKLESTGNGFVNAKVGVMFRDNLSTGSKMATMLFKPKDGRAIFLSRTSAGAFVNNQNVTGRNVPLYLRVTRSGNTFTGFISNNGSNWQQIGQANISMGNNVKVGLAASSNEPGKKNTYVFTNVSVNCSGNEDPNPDPDPDPEPTVCGDLPGIWTSTDVGAVGKAGKACFDSETTSFSIEGSGVNIGGNADEFHFLYQDFNCNGEIIAKLASVESGFPDAKIGIMIREKMSANAKMVAVLLKGNDKALFQRRTSESASHQSTVVGGISTPRYLRLKRSGNTFTGYVGTNGVNWTQIGSINLTMNQNVQIGLAVNSHEDGQLSTAVFENVSVFCDGNNPNPDPDPDPDPDPTPIGCDALPNIWSGADIGEVASGEVCYNDAGTYKIKGAGDNIGGDDDEQYFLYQTLNCNNSTEVIANVTNIQNGFARPKVGVMIREGLGDGAKMATVLIKPDGAVFFVTRDKTGAFVDQIKIDGKGGFKYVRIRRQGNTFTGFISTNGSNWQQIGTANFSMNNNMMAGLAVCSSESDEVIETTFANVQVICDGQSSEPAPAPTQYTLTTQAGTGGIVIPNGNNTYEEGTSVTVIATADNGYVFKNFTNGDGSVASNLATYQFTMDADVTLRANFEVAAPPTEVSLTTQSGGNGSVSPSGVNTFLSGTQVTVTATPNQGYEFKDYTDGDGNVVSTSASYTFIINGNLSLTANFQVPPVQYTLTTQAGEGGTVNPSGSNAYDEGALVTVTATPQTGYNFLNYTDQNDTELSTNPVYSFNITADVTVQANFEVNPIIPCALPNAWKNSDVGNTGKLGDVCYENGSFEIDGAGDNIQGRNDDFHFVYQDLSCDGEIIAQIQDIDEVSSHTRVGVMIRETLANTSKQAAMLLRPNGVGLFVSRVNDDVTSNRVRVTGKNVPEYVRVKRSGNTFTAYTSNNGINWTTVGSTNISMASNVKIGLVVCSTERGTLASATFNNVVVSCPNQVVVNSGPSAGVTANPIVETEGSKLSDDMDFVADPAEEQAKADANIVSVYPNPLGKEFVTVKFSKAVQGKLNFRVRNTMGLLQGEGSVFVDVTSNEIKIDMSTLNVQSGIYQLEIQGNGFVTQYPIVLK